MSVLLVFLAGIMSVIGLHLYTYFKQEWGLSLRPSWLSFLSFGIMQAFALIMIAVAVGVV